MGTHWLGAANEHSQSHDKLQHLHHVPFEIDKATLRCDLRQNICIFTAFDPSATISETLRGFKTDIDDIVGICH